MVPDVVEEDPHPEAIELAEEHVEAMAEETAATAPIPAILTEEEGVSTIPEPVLQSVECAEEAAFYDVFRSTKD